jgi:hypothetical protein
MPLARLTAPVHNRCAESDPVAARKELQPRTEQEH